jgi:anti-sigma factor RsiW
MRCKNAREMLYMSEYPEIITRDSLEAKRHLKECRECREFIESEEAFGSMLKDAIKKEPVPEELMNSIFSEKQRKKRRFSSLFKRLTIAASILLIVTAGYLYSISKGDPVIFSQIVNDHIQFISTENRQIISSKPEEIVTWFKGKVDFTFNVLNISAKLKGGRLCLLDQKRLALLLYEYNDSPLSLYITDELALKDIKTGRKLKQKNRRMVLIEEKGYNLLLWEDKGLTYTLITELDIEDIIEII